MTYDVFDQDHSIRFSSNIYYAKPKITIGDIIDFGYDENEKAIVVSIVDKHGYSQILNMSFVYISSLKVISLNLKNQLIT